MTPPELYFAQILLGILVYYLGRIGGERKERNRINDMSILSKRRHIFRG